MLIVVGGSGSARRERMAIPSGRVRMCSLDVVRERVRAFRVRMAR